MHCLLSKIARRLAGVQGVSQSLTYLKAGTARGFGPFGGYAVQLLYCLDYFVVALAMPRGMAAAYRHRSTACRLSSALSLRQENLRQPPQLSILALQQAHLLPLLMSPPLVIPPICNCHS